MVALILADGDAPTRDELDRGWPGWFDDVDLVIAADGGARHADALGVRIDLWVGDGDSLGEAGLAVLAAAGVAIERSPVDKDETDTELAIDAALRSDAMGIVLVGALGGPRVDHALANVSLLTLPALAGRAVSIYTSHSCLRLVRGARGQAASRDPDAPAGLALTGAPGDIVSLLPIGGDADGVTTQGLRFPLTDEPLLQGSSRGVSNVIAAAGARVAVRQGTLLVIESPATLQP